MEKPSYKLVGAPCGHHGQYTFYKALRVTGATERIIAIGDFFFVKIWQDSELVSIGELQLLWTDRVSDQTLVSLRLYCLPENTPDGRGLHGEDEVLAINDKVVLRADDLLSWMCTGSDWTYGLRAVWRGACAPPGDSRLTAPLHHTRLDFSDVEKEKDAIAVDTESPGVVVFSYPRYCRYRALVARLEGIQAAWLRDSLVAALGGYAAPTTNTRILYCKDTFEYPELEGHEFVCNHLAPKLKGRPRGRRRRPPRSRTQSPESRSSEDDRPLPPEPTSPSPRRLSLRNGIEKRSSDSDPDREPSEEDRAFLRELRHFHKDKGARFAQALSLKHLSLRALYTLVLSRGGFDAMCRLRLWKPLFHARHHHTRAVYERFLLPFENHERRNGIKPNGLTETEPITVCDSPPPTHEQRDCETGEVKEESNRQKAAEDLNREFLDSLSKDEKPIKITVKPVEKLIDAEKLDLSLDKEKEKRNFVDEKWNLSGEKWNSSEEKWNLSDDKRNFAEEKRNFGDRDVELKEGEKKEFLNELANKLNLGNYDTAFIAELARRGPCIQPTAALQSAPINGHADASNEQKSSRPLPAGRSSLRAVRVKPARAHTAPNTAPNTPPVPPLRPDSASSSPPAATQGTAAPVTNFGIHHPPPPPQNNNNNSNNSDDEIVEVPYKPKTPEIIDLDEYPESPQAVKKKKLDILKERGLEVTPLPAPAPGPWTAPVLAPIIPPNTMLLNPAVQHQLMTNAQLFQMYNILPTQNYNGMQPPKVIQATPLYGTTSPEKTVYGNPKDPFMPPPHVLHGAPIKPAKSVMTTPPPPQDILDLTCKLNTKPAVEIVRVPTTPSPSKTTAQNLSKNYSIVDGKAVVGSNLEITLVNKAQPPSPIKKQTPQKRSSNGKFTKTPTPPKEYPKPYKKTPIIVPTYQVREDSPTSSTSSQNSQKTDPKMSFDPKAQYLDPTKTSPFMDPSKMPASFLDPAKAASFLDPSKAASYLDPSKAASFLDPSKAASFLDQAKAASFMDPTKAPTSFLDPSKGPVSSFLDPYMALYNLAGQMDPRQLAAYREIMANPFRYSSLLNMGVNPTTKN